METLVKDNTDFTEAVNEIAEKMEMEQSAMMPEGNDRLREEKLEMLEMLKDLEALTVQRGETEP
jgi:PHP family Zn ribbon phosphoesterase